jgi:hypothetical protein
VLYVPTEGSRMADDEAAKNKELVQRLESKCTCFTAFLHIAVRPH